MLFSVQRSKSLWQFFLLLGETDTMLQVEAITGNRTQNGNYRTTGWFVFFQEGSINIWKKDQPTPSNYSSVEKLTTVLTALTSDAAGKTPSWWIRVRSYASMPQGIFPFWERDAVLPPLLSVITHPKTASYFIPSLHYSLSFLFPPSRHLPFSPGPRLNLPGTQKGSK